MQKVNIKVLKTFNFSFVQDKMLKNNVVKMLQIKQIICQIFLSTLTEREFYIVQANFTFKIASSFRQNVL